MKSVLLFLLVVAVGFTVPGCEKDEETLSFKDGVFKLQLKKNMGYSLGLGRFFPGDLVVISKQPTHAKESVIFADSQQTYYRYFPQPDFTGTDEAEIKVTSQGEVTLFPVKITVK